MSLLAAGFSPHQSPLLLIECRQPAERPLQRVAEAVDAVVLVREQERVDRVLERAAQVIDQVRPQLGHVGALWYASGRQINM